MARFLCEFLSETLCAHCGKKNNHEGTQSTLKDAQSYDLELIF